MCSEGCYYHRILFNTVAETTQMIFLKFRLKQILKRFLSLKLIFTQSGREYMYFGLKNIGGGYTLSKQNQLKLRNTRYYHLLYHMEKRCTIY